MSLELARISSCFLHDLAKCTGRATVGRTVFFQLGNPEANAQAGEASAVLVIKEVGCQDPATANVTANATGILEGKPKTIQLELIRLKEVGTFALARRWPKQ